jgi:hypothetical protein
MPPRHPVRIREAGCARARVSAVSRALLHVGSPKTGTTFLQAVLWQARDQLREAGILLPGRSIHQHFQASLEVRGTPERARYPELIEGAWQRLLDSAGSWDGDLLISHELFASAPAEGAAAAVADLVARGYEPHLVLTARDLARQLPAEWQERLKHKSTITFAEFMTEIAEPGTEIYERLWAAQDYADIVARWADGLPRAQVHLVTVPPPGAAPDVLWQRFAAVLDVDPAAYSLEVPLDNSSLGLEQVTLLRQVNERLGEGRLLMPGTYTGIGKGLLSHQVLAARPGIRLVLGGADLAFAREHSERTMAALAARELTVHGDLVDLAVTGDAEISTARTEVAPGVLLEESLEVLTDVLAAMGERVTEWDESRRDLQAELKSVRGRLAAEREHATELQRLLDVPLRHRVVGALRASVGRRRSREERR